MALIVDGGGGLGDNAPNFVELNNAPPAAAPWLIDYAAPPKATLAIGPVKITAPKTKKAATKTAAPAPFALKRAGSLGSILDQILPIVSDESGRKTIYGLPPALIYVAGGALLTTLGVYLVRLILGGGGRRRRAFNPKRAPRRPRRGLA